MNGLGLVQVLAFILIGLLFAIALDIRHEFRGQISNLNHNKEAVARRMSANEVYLSDQGKVSKVSKKEISK